MNWNPDNRVLKFMRVGSDLYFPAVLCCPESVARQAASLMYYHAEAGYCALTGWYTPPRLLGGNAIAQCSTYIASAPAIMQAFMDITNDLMAYYQERDPVVLESLREKCGNSFASFGLEEVPGILAAIQDYDAT